jgi:hypothetical protein
MRDGARQRMFLISQPCNGSDAKIFRSSKFNILWTALQVYPLHHAPGNQRYLPTRYENETGQDIECLPDAVDSQYTLKVLDVPLLLATN